MARLTVTDIERLGLVDRCEQPGCQAPPTILEEGPRLLWCQRHWDNDIATVHVTRVSDASVYGHTEDHCDPQGCNGVEQFYPKLARAAEAGEIKAHDVVNLTADGDLIDVIRGGGG